MRKLIGIVGLAAAALLAGDEEILRGRGQGGGEGHGKQGRRNQEGGPIDAGHAG